MKVRDIKHNQIWFGAWSFKMKAQYYKMYCSHSDFYMNLYMQISLYYTRIKKPVPVYDVIDLSYVKTFDELRLQSAVRLVDCLQGAAVWGAKHGKNQIFRAKNSSKEVEVDRLYPLKTLPCGFLWRAYMIVPGFIVSHCYNRKRFRIDWLYQNVSTNQCTTPLQ